MKDPILDDILILDTVKQWRAYAEARAVDGFIAMRVVDFHIILNGLEGLVGACNGYRNSAVMATEYSQELFQCLMKIIARFNGALPMLMLYGNIEVIKLASDLQRELIGITEAFREKQEKLMEDGNEPERQGDLGETEDG